MPPKREPKSRYAVLGALAIEPMSGYDIKNVLTRSVRHFWNESYGQIYPTLKDLAAADLITSKTQPANGKPDRTVYTLTDAGWRELRGWLARPVDSHHPGRSELLLKVFFGRHAAAGATLDLVREHRALLTARIAQYEAIEAELEAEDDPDPPYWLSTLRHGVLVAQASLEWCDETLTRLSKVGIHG